MNHKITSLHDVIRYQLQRLNGMERTLHGALGTCSTHITSPEVKNEMKLYDEHSADKLLKLERAMSYLSDTPKVSGSHVISDLIAETQYLMENTPSIQLRNVLMVSCLQNINAFKMSSYRNAYLFLLEMELDNAADLIRQALEWEVATQSSLKSLSMTEFNNANAQLDSNVLSKLHFKS